MWVIDGPIKSKLGEWTIGVLIIKLLLNIVEHFLINQREGHLYRFLIERKILILSRCSKKKKKSVLNSGELQNPLIEFFAI